MVVSNTSYSINSGRAQGKVSGSQRVVQKPINYNLLGGFESRKNNSKQSIQGGGEVDLGGREVREGVPEGRVGKVARGSMPVNVFDSGLPSSRFDNVTNVHNSLADKRRKVLLSDMWGTGRKGESDFSISKQLDRGYTLDSGDGDFLSRDGELGEGIEKVGGVDTPTHNFDQHRLEVLESSGSVSFKPFMSSDKKPKSILKSFSRGATLYAPSVSNFRGPQAPSSFRRRSLGIGSNGTIEDQNGLARPLPSIQKSRDGEFAS